MGEEDENRVAAADCSERPRRHHTHATTTTSQGSFAWCVECTALKQAHARGYAEAREAAAAILDSDEQRYDNHARAILRTEGDDPHFRAQAQRLHQAALERKAVATRIRALVAK